MYITKINTNSGNASSHSSWATSVIFEVSIWRELQRVNEVRWVHEDGLHDSCVGKGQSS